MNTYYDIDGTPLDGVMAWADLFEARMGEGDPNECWWHKRTVLDDLSVSTVWLGIDHSFGLGGPPLIYETMLFGDHPFAENQEQWRYATRVEAWQHHRVVVRAVWHQWWFRRLVATLVMVDILLWLSKL